MPFPKLNFADRIGVESPDRIWIQCVRTPHARIRKLFGSEEEARRWLAEHDRKHHTRAIEPTPVRHEEFTLKMLADVYIAHGRELMHLGDRDPKTIKFYEQCTRFLLAFFGPDYPVQRIDRHRISQYIVWRKKEFGTEGACVQKEISLLQTMYTWRFGIGLPWTLKAFKSEIRPKKREKRLYTKEEIQEFISAMEEGSLERAFTVMKYHTGLRNEELYNLRVQDVDLLSDPPVVTYQLRNKGAAKRREFMVLTPSVVRAITPMLRRKRPGDLVFTMHGRQLQGTSLRKRFMAASARVNEARAKALGRELREEERFPLVQSVADFRAEMMTELADTLGIETVSRGIAHNSVATTERHYWRKRIAENLKRRQVMAETMEKNAPVN